MRALKHRLIWGVLLIGATLTCMQLQDLYRLHTENQWLQTLAGGHDIATDVLVNADPAVRLARAAYLRQMRRYQEATDTLSLVASQGNRDLQCLSQYNLGNVFLAQAMAEIEADRINQAIPLLGLAKQAYRMALRLNSGFWDAKYNLELAAGLLPDFERIGNDRPDDNQAPPAQPWTTIPGFPRGLP